MKRMYVVAAALASLILCTNTFASKSSFPFPADDSCDLSKAITIPKPTSISQYYFDMTFRGKTSTLKSYDLALKNCQKVIKETDADSLYDLGVIYLMGPCPADNFAKAQQRFAQAAQLGHAPSQYNLGVMLLHGLGIQKNLKQAFAIFCTASEKKEPKALYTVARMVINATKDPKRILEAIDLIKMAAQLGEPRAQYDLAELYLQDKNAECRVDDALKLFLSAFRQGEPRAYTDVGLMFLMGIEFNADPIEAIKSFMRRDARSRCFSELRCEEDDFNDRFQIAFQLFQYAAAFGESRAKKNLGLMYLDGLSVQEDSKLGMQLLKESALQGNQDAQEFLKGYKPQDQRKVDFTLLPTDVLIHLTKFMTSCDALNFLKICRRTYDIKSQIKQGQLPHLYKDINKDFSKAIIEFPHPFWQPEAKMPALVSTLIHDWYLAGRKIKDPFKKFCHLLAAGRAGHYYAAFEAGQMLRDEDISPKVIPVVVTMEDLVHHVREFGIPEVQAWDISNLNQEMIDDPLILDMYKKVNALWSQENAFNNIYFDIFKCRTTEQAEPVLDHFFNRNKEILDRELEKLSYNVCNKCAERQLFSSLMNLIRQYIESTLFEELPESLRQSQAQAQQVNLESDELEINEETRSYLENVKTFDPSIINLIEERVKAATKPDIKAFQMKQSEYMNTPLYWWLLSTFYRINKQPLEREESLKTLLAMRLNTEACGELAECLYEKDNDYCGVDGLYKEEVRALYLLACLLGDADYLEDLVSSIEPYFLPFETDEATRLEQSRPIDIRLWGPMVAFTLQLSALRSPDQKDVYDVIENFYNLGRGADHMHADRADAAAEIGKQMDEEESSSEEDKNTINE